MATESINSKLELIYKRDVGLCSPSSHKALSVLLLVYFKNKNKRN